jgi:hypothetical protein
MRSGWFFGSSYWADYLFAYSSDHPQCRNEYRSSPLANDADLSEAYEQHDAWLIDEHETMVLDMRLHQWADLRKSYHALIHRAQDRFDIREHHDISAFRAVHRLTFGEVRSEGTFDIQQRWCKEGIGMAVVACERDLPVAAAYWIIYQGGAYYASGPALQRNVMHGVIWASLELLKTRGVHRIDMGQTDGKTQKEKNIGKFKSGFGGTAMPFTIARRIV